MQYSKAPRKLYVRQTNPPLLVSQQPFFEGIKEKLMIKLAYIHFVLTLNSDSMVMVISVPQKNEVMTCNMHLNTIFEE
jgi:hypothetical protein